MVESLGPSSRRTGIVITEILCAPVARPDGRDLSFIELYNSNPFFEDLSGWSIRGGVEFTFPTNTIMAGNAFLVVAGKRSDLVAVHHLTNVIGSFEGKLAPITDRIRLQKRSGAIVLALTYSSQSPWPTPAGQPGRSLVLSRPSYGENDGRAWDLSAAPDGTPGRPNDNSAEHATRPFDGGEIVAGPGPVIISELMYHPMPEAAGGEFIELFNPGAELVDMAGWRLAGAIQFSFPTGVVLKPKGFVVVGKDPSHLRAVYPHLSSESCVGPYRGSLGNQGELVRLVHTVATGPSGAAQDSVSDEVTYETGGRWGQWADGGGSSLERVEARANPNLPSTWADSDETAKAAWCLIETSGELSFVHPAVPQADELQIILLGAGEMLVDDIEVIANGANRIRNPTFENGLSGWFFQGTHRLSQLEENEGYQSQRCLRLVASERGDHVANRVRTPLSQRILVGAKATIRARVRWLRGHPEILFRLRNGGLEASGRAVVPANLGTPGLANSRAIANGGPGISGVQHRPALPRANEPITITARVEDVDGLRHVWVHYRLDPSTNIVTVPMVDDGTGGDPIVNDGDFTGIIPGQSSGQLIAFHIEATDAAAPEAAAQFPTDAPIRECLVRVGESEVPGAFASYRLWLTRASVESWAARAKMSNEDLDATFVYGTNRVYYNIGAHYSGSSYSAPGYTSPVGALCGYDLRFGKDERFLGETHVILDWPIRDPTDQREQLMFWFLEQYGLPNLYRRYVHLFVNGLRRGTIYDDVQQPNGNVIEQWWPADAEGTLLKTDAWNEFDANGNRVDPLVLNTLEDFSSGGVKKVSRYRWNWRPRAVHGSANDFSDLFTLVDAVNSSSNYIANVQSQVEMEHWMRTFAMNDLASYWDGFGNPNAKNTFLYKPERGRWQLLCWDFDVGLGVFNDPPNAALFDVNDPTIARIYRTPAFVRLYWDALSEAMNSWFDAAPGSPVDALLNAKYAALRANNVAVTGPSSIKTWMAQRRVFLGNQLGQIRASFAVDVPSDGISADRDILTLTGSGPVAMRTLFVNGTERSLRWTSITNWSVDIPLHAGVNELSLRAYDRSGARLPGGEGSVRVRFGGDPLLPPPIKINEWMAANDSAIKGPLDEAFPDWLELFNPTEAPVDLDGWTLTDDVHEPQKYRLPVGTRLAAHGYLVVWADERADSTPPGSELHANFKLNQQGDTIVLFDNATRLVDQVQFAFQPANSSSGRYPDGASLPAAFSCRTLLPALPTLRRSECPDFLRLTWQSVKDGNLEIRWTGPAQAASGCRRRPWRGGSRLGSLSSSGRTTISRFESRSLVRHNSTGSCWSK
ncbi:MAG: lamin tail domain-containing protein [Verrucomicrobiota bacterium]